MSLADLHRSAVGRALFEGTPTPTSLLRVDDGGLWIVATSRSATQTGWEREEMHDVALRSLVPEPIAARIEEAVAGLEEPGDQARREVSLEVPAGTRVYDVTVIEVEPIDGQRYVLTVSVDVTEARRTEAALLETQTLARIGHWSWDLTTDQLWCTDQVAHIYGLVPADGPTDVEFFWGQVLPEDEPDLRVTIGAAVEGRTSFEAEYRVLGWGSEPRTVHTVGVTVTDDDGQALRIAGTVQDVTEQRATERLVRLAEQARDQHRRALEMNDGVVQGLATARLALAVDDHEQALRAIDRTMEAARSIVSDLLGPEIADGIHPGDLVRATPADGAVDAQT